LRSQQEKEAWFSRDPIKRLAKHMVEHKLATPEELKAIEKRIQAVIDDAVQFAQDSPEPDPSELYRYVFAED
jgi:pyruvate dehydrogenase E1 component alpha subunit